MATNNNANHKEQNRSNNVHFISKKNVQMLNQRLL